MNENTPTRTNLTRAQRFLAFSRRGHSLLDRKKRVLMREMMSRVQACSEAAGRLDEAYKAAMEALVDARITLSSHHLENLVRSVPASAQVEMLGQSVMGVELPRLFVESGELTGSYGMYRSEVSLDLAMEAARRLRQILFEYTELHAGIARLSREIRRTSKKANSIEKIQIPHYEELVRSISQSLAEKEREDLFRLKLMKRRLSEAE